jgi:ABC-type Fe3+-hydroxamate transport system substrate-binding protein
MNMISTGAFQTEMDASNNQSAVAKKFAAVWEKKNAKVARAGGVSLMALSLAACGSDDTATTTSTTTTTTATTTTTTTAVAADTITLTAGPDTAAGGAGATTINALVEGLLEAGFGKRNGSEDRVISPNLKAKLF